MIDQDTYDGLMVIGGYAVAGWIALVLGPELASLPAGRTVTLLFAGMVAAQLMSVGAFRLTR